jgi:putative ABC transport system ATP-binding protein
MEALKASGVCRGYDGRKVLDGFDLSVAPGAFEALMGPSGCGKSTFLNLAAGLLAVDGGEIAIGGEIISRMGDAQATRFRRRRIGVVFQQYNLLGERTVEENVLLPVRLDGRVGDAARARFAALMEKLGLSGREKDLARKLSGGEQQRVAIARALVTEPEIVLADEPTGNLDVEAARTVSSTLAELGRSEKSAILVVTHDPVIAARAERVHFLRGGRVAGSFDPAGDPALVSARYLETYR